MIIDSVDGDIFITKQMIPPDIDGVPQPQWNRNLVSIYVTQDMIPRPFFIETQTRFDDINNIDVCALNLNDDIILEFANRATARGYFEILNSPDFEGKDISKDFPELKI